jgi:hypothetical protein
MAEIRERVRADLRARLVARGASDDFADEAVFRHVDALFRRAAALDDRQALLLPELLANEWRPELALELASHRGGLAGPLLVFVKRRLLLPLNRWLFEYTLENFRRQERVNLVLMSCLQALAAEHARLLLSVDRARISDDREPRAGARTGAAHGHDADRAPRSAPHDAPAGPESSRSR